MHSSNCSDNLSQYMGIFSYYACMVDIYIYKYRYYMHMCLCTIFQFFINSFSTLICNCTMHAMGGAGQSYNSWCCVGDQIATTSWHCMICKGRLYARGCLCQAFQVLQSLDQHKPFSLERLHATSQLVLYEWFEFTATTIDGGVGNVTF